MRKGYNLGLIKVTSFLSFVFIILSCAGPKITTGINDAKAPTKASVINVQTDLDAESAYKKLGQTLQSRGYRFNSTDETLKSITTDFIDTYDTLGKSGAYVSINSYIKGESNVTIVIKGNFQVINYDNDRNGQKIEKFGQGNSPARKAWKEMFILANSLGGSLSFN